MNIKTIDTTHLARFNKARCRFLNAIKKALQEDGCCKSYEGQVSIVFPHLFTENFMIETACYVIGDSRGEQFLDVNFDKCLDKFEKWMDEYCKEYENV